MTIQQTNTAWIMDGKPVLRLVGEKIDKQSAFGYASPVAAKSATGFASPNLKGGYRHCVKPSGIVVSSTWLFSGRSCGNSPELPVSFEPVLQPARSPFLRLQAQAGHLNPIQRRTAMQTAPQLRLIKGTNPVMSAEVLINQFSRTNPSPAPLEELIAYLPESLRDILDGLLDSYDYSNNLTESPAVCCRMLAAIIGSLEYRLKEFSRD